MKSKNTARTTSNAPAINNHARYKVTKLTFSSSRVMPGGGMPSILPNFAIRNGNIQIEKPKPAFTESTDTECRKALDWALSNSAKIQSHLTAIGKVLVLYKDLNKDADIVYNFNEGTYSVVRLKSGYCVGLTALHITKLPCLAEMVMLLVDTEITSGLVELANGALQRYLDNQPEGVTLTGAVSYVVHKLEEPGIAFGVTNISTESLLYRKQWIEKHTKEKDGILDKTFGYQPHPTLDVMVFELPKEHLEKMHAGSITPLDISSLSLQIGDFMGLIGYQNNALIIKKSPVTSDEKTTTKENCQTLKFFPEDVKLENYVHPGKLISCTKVKVWDELLLYEGTSSEGTSGGPLLNSNGEIVGMSVGNYFEYQTEDSTTGVAECSVNYPKLMDIDTAGGRKALIDYDMKSSLENKPASSSMLVDFNIAVRMKHGGLREILDEVDFKDSFVADVDEVAPSDDEITEANKQNGPCKSSI
eukprot:TRINITY_DN3862_c0_g1_i2.p1 TRINITY_DN3862_c0_g1~~TRINITY_DN3862_c0_g1_i2.p1  ORF type:complete len:511 (+),score=42.09 TRINITY_DN3862_c0_g1_i2:114-1535(+)